MKMKNLIISKFKSGFTLAEVLITLVIVGVIAAMTIPTLINKYKEQEIENRLRKAYSTLANGIKMSEIQNGSFAAWPIGAEITDIDDYFNKYFRPYFTGVKLCSNSFDCGYDFDLSSSKWQNKSWTVATTNNRLFFMLSDGTTIFYPISSKDAQGQPTYTTAVYIDVNGTKNPNTYCEDVFLFVRNYEKNSIDPAECTVAHFRKNSR